MSSLKTEQTNSQSKRLRANKKGKTNKSKISKLQEKGSKLLGKQSTYIVLKSTDVIYSALGPGACTEPAASAVS